MYCGVWKMGVSKVIENGCARNGGSGVVNMVWHIVGDAYGR